MNYIFAIIMALILVYIFMAFKKSRKGRSKADRVKEERAETVKQHEALKRRLINEQSDAQRRVELRNKTLELYEQVRNQAENDDNDNPA